MIKRSGPTDDDIAALAILVGDTCSGCGKPAHASETDDEGYHPQCRTRDALADALHAAERAHVDALRTGDQRKILHAFRGALAAESALLHDCPGKADRDSATQLDYEIEAIDREIADLARADARTLQFIPTIAT